MVLKIGIAIKDVTILKSLGNENNYQIQILNSSDIGEINFIDNYWDIIIWQPEFSNHKIPEIFIKYFNRNKNALLIVCCSDKKKFNIIKSIPNHFVFEIDNFYSNAALNLLLDNIELIRKQKSLYLKDNISIMQDNVSELVGKSSSVKEINEFIHLIAKTSNTHCLIRGEVGSEKRVVEKLIHRNCKTILGPLQFINCANYSEKQMSFKLFGADSEKELTAENQNGALEMSTDGTVVLENIERLPEELQQRLQIFLETQTFRRDKSDFELSVNTRVIATTSYDLENFVTQGKFLKELYYRFKAFEIFIPPLRQRKNDIIPIANHFIDYFNNIFGYNVKGITKAVEQRLIN